MDRALRRREPFIYLRSGWGMDSQISSAIVATRGGAVLFYYADTLGPAFKGTCLRQNVLSAPAGWPVCRRELAEQIDLRTCKPYQERYRSRYEEPWPAGCDTRAPALPAGRPLRHTPLFPDPERWDLRCDRIELRVEAIIDETGRVQCTRVADFWNRDLPPPEGLYDEIRKNAMQWKFAPPTVYGQPIAVRWGLYDGPDCGRAK